ncbi:hypothetical protein COCMIDRAFT_38882 [Bipolaris oryzae ATCC 44560]|uniref:WSC domain-containing protein n=1 Tax=Bipolaris oryzae ATCC 44560 TaxID=930090 RepID=W6ZHW4_COCMI|nr:uncharacterized protein COCMIDRAFT_38882 [Bipolaris oryzae ATCC 44560]EUC43151.1 hypothetical protein COCMIDRAFT_38882 [Bipolaris oryzae ATCC 44560]
MRASLVFFVSALSVGVYSFETQQVLGSANPVGTSYQCQNGAAPAAACTDPSNVPTCSCSCSNGVMYNEPLSAHTSRNPNPFPDTCQAEKDDCLEREKTLTAQVTEAQEKHTECEATSLADRQKAEMDALQQDQNCKLELSNKDVEISQCKQQSTNDINAANSACKAQLSSKEIEITQCKQKSVNDLNAANSSCKAKEDALNTKFSNYQKNNYRYIGCYEDNNSRVLAQHSKHDTKMTPQMCASICQNYTYFGVEIGSECYCGNTIKSGYKKVDGGACSSKCQGDAGQICGGGWRASIYSRQA